MRKLTGFLALVWAGAFLCSCRKSDGPAVAALPEFVAGIAFTNVVVPDRPWSILVARIARHDGGLEIHSMHADGGVLGLKPLSHQVRAIPSEIGTPLAAINGDFYQRDRAYAGDPRGLQIINGELISAPAGTASLWIDAAGAAQAANVQAQFQVTWPDGTSSKFGLNENRPANGVVLYTPAIGATTRTTSGVEFVLERNGSEPWLPLRAGETFSARVREVREGGNTRLTNDLAVLSLGPAAAGAPARITPGAVLKLSTATRPDVRGARTAIGGGPVLVHQGKRQKIDAAGLFDENSYSARSMQERHPRSAVGWNDKYFFFVQVDGRHKTSVGMTLAELADYLIGLGCQEAMNLDGGGSATFWWNGTVANRPCDKRERDIANGLVVLRPNAARAAK